ncbi:Methyltransferase FkbM domain-containing protein [Enhydrobacter aerosaccus]|uniref:Methyltransferase FkbM domain-containing protein n=1 Tax=Enhydrobacter aerosaccus TaxID=225324 RepID=A0A1T4KK35_9HYPH|nr:FkbM family methyltransferase [Enhydrobacter aerosaccus]SJZ42737.1 Methyltransferase FkbM domain-containing protein [Enhydrobacter aerosaccus]
MPASFAELVARSLKSEPFALVDVGCSGGIDPKWRVFEPQLRILGIDASEGECRRLASLEKGADADYVAGFAGLPEGHPLRHKTSVAPIGDLIQPRFSYMRTREIRRAWLAQAPHEERMRQNEWQTTELADEARTIVVPQLLAERGWKNVDYLKIDIDRDDFEVLLSFDGRFEEFGLMAVQLEVMFIGSDSDLQHSFHNTDRFMRRQGFELFDLEVRRYSTRALPGRYIWPTPAETEFGRPFMGEAYYALDPAAAKGCGRTLDAGKLAKLAAIFSLWNVPDVAAELLLAERSVFEPLFSVDAALDALAAQVQPFSLRRRSYADYLAQFEKDSAAFYRPEGHVPLRERLAAAWRGFVRPRR